MVEEGAEGRETLRCGEVVEAEVGAGGALVSEDTAEAVVAVAALGEVKGYVGEGGGCESGNGYEGSEGTHFM